MRTVDAFLMHQALEELRSSRRLLSAKFAFAAAYNSRQLQMIVDAAREAVKGPWDDTINAFDEARRALLDEHVARDEANNPVIVGTNFALKDPEAFQTAFAALREAHPDIDAATQERNEVAARVEGEEVETPPLRKIALDQFPAELTLAQMEALYPMVEDGDPS